MLTNEKLFLRAVGIVRDVAGASADVAHRSILRAVHEGAIAVVQPAKQSSGGAEWWEDPDLPLVTHVAAAATKPLVIPVALLLAQDEVLRSSSAGVQRAEPLSPSAARELLAREPRVARVMSALERSESARP